MPGFVAMAWPRSCKPSLPFRPIAPPCRSPAGGRSGDGDDHVAFLAVGISTDPDSPCGRAYGLGALLPVRRDCAVSHPQCDGLVVKARGFTVRRSQTQTYRLHFVADAGASRNTTSPLCGVGISSSWRCPCVRVLIAAGHVSDGGDCIFMALTVARHAAVLWIELSLRRNKQDAGKIGCALHPRSRVQCLRSESIASTDVLAQRLSGYALAVPASDVTEVPHAARQPACTLEPRLARHRVQRIHARSA